MADGFKKPDPSRCCLHYTQTGSEGMEKDVPRKWKPKKPAAALLVSDKRDFETKSVIRDKKGIT